MKIINVMNHPPAYELYIDKPKPEINWNTPNGSWVGIWGYDWANQIGNYLLKISNEFEYEVWQPDYRADKVYQYTFKNGLTHRLFPASKKSYFFGFMKKVYLTSKILIQELKTEVNSNTILHLPYPNTFLIQEIIKELKDIKIVCSSYGDIYIPMKNFWKLNINFPNKINLIKRQLVFKEIFSYVNVFTLINNNDILRFKKLYKGPISILPMGVDESFWKSKNKKECRRLLGLDSNKLIILSNSRLDKNKQIDRLIRVLNKLALNYDFIYIVTGSGGIDYVKYLIGLAKPLIESRKIIFTGYVSDEELLNYFNAADVFTLVSKSEGSPVAVQKAFFCKTPVLSTNTGLTSELMKKYDVGKIIDKSNYETWTQSLIEIFRGNIPKHFDYKLAKNYFDWENIAQKLLSIYTKL